VKRLILVASLLVLNAQSLLLAKDYEASDLSVPTVTIEKVGPVYVIDIKGTYTLGKKKTRSWPSPLR
jgi:hypothetical protein